MINDVYRNAFKEVYDILENTEKELVIKIPTKFINFIKNNMNNNYKSNIQTNVGIDKQQLSKETEAILALIYRSYWATDEEKKKFAIKDHQEIIEKEEYQGIDIYEIFEKRKNINNITIDNNLMVIKKENFIKRIFNKVLNILKRK